MRTLGRNKRPFHYATFVEKRFVFETDEYGNEVRTGEYEVVYSDPMRCEANISPASGIAATEIFGTAEGYDKVIVTNDMTLPIDERSILWIEAETDAPHDYIVKRVARSLNSVAIAARKVSVGE